MGTQTGPQGGMPMEAYMTAKEAADYLKIAERTLVRLAHEGKIPGVKIGGQWRFRRALLDEYLDHLASQSVTTSAISADTVYDLPLNEILSVDQIIPKLEAPDRAGVIAGLVEHVTKLGLVKDQSWFEAALAARERLVPTAVPEGVAFLHARRRIADMFPKQFIAVGRSPEGIAFAPDMGKTRVFFLLALRNDTLHVRWLSRLAWIARSPGWLNRLGEADSAESMYQALIEAADSLPKSLAPTGQAMAR